MIDRLSGYRGRDDVVVIPRIRVTFALSILVHVVALWLVLPRLPLLAPGMEEGQASDRLEVQIAAPPAVAVAPPAPPSPTAPAPARETRAILTARARPRNAPPREAPPVLTVPSREVPEIPVPPPTPPAVVEPAPAPPPIEGDMASYIEARRRARGEPSAPAESDNERRDRIVAANVAAMQRPGAGQERKRGGGIFEITRMAYDDAEFIFFGWSNDARRNLRQKIEVRLGSNSDMRIAVVRRMIAIIRENVQGDFQWQSPGPGGIVVLSARPADNAGLEDFMLRDLFDAAPRSSSR
jgi:hypothetical protein